jgi:hypothetical protein
MSEAGEQFVLEKAQTHDWCLCLFLSVDLENATDYKLKARLRQQEDGWTTDNDWCAVFEQFYREFPIDFYRAYSLLSEHRETKNICQPFPPVLWKFAGDEILFYAPLTDARQTLEHLDAFAQTIINSNAGFAKRGITLRCKGTAWLAGFPINNRIVLMSRSNGQPPFIDFIGSSIDTGFRLSKFSSPRRLAISLDLLWILAICGLQCRYINRFGWLRYRYFGDHVLKGVLRGCP